MTAIAILHRDEILQRVAAGEYLASIAASLGLQGKGQAISNALVNDPEYHAHRELGLEARLAQREAEVERSERDDVPRARELLSHARWRAEREAPHRWGAKQIVEHQIAPVLHIHVAAAQHDERTVAVQNSECDVLSNAPDERQSRIANTDASAQRRSAHLDQLAALTLSPTAKRTVRRATRGDTSPRKGKGRG